MHRTPIALALILGACTAGEPSETDVPADTDDTDDTDTTTEAQPRAITSPSADLASVLAGGNDLGLDLLRAGSDADDNAVLAPLGITAALGMTLGGARGDTASQLEAALGVAVDPDVWHTELGALLADLDGDKGRAYTLGVANGAFGQEGYPFEPDYLDLTGTTYGAPLQALDFAADPASARDTVNEWVAEETLDRVPELFPAGSITDATRLVLANAIALEALWASPFPAEATTAGTFHAPGGDVTVPFMRLEESFRYAEADLGQLVVLPYQGEALSMVVVVPAAGLEDVRALDSASLDAWIASAEPQDGSVALPRFEVTSALPLADALATLGVTDLFDPDRADLTGIADPSAGRLWVSGAFHGATISVDEEGTVAGAGTGVVVTTDTATEPFAFTADRPFLFVLRDDLTGAILFLGQVADPS